MIFLDANIFLRVLLRDHPVFFPRCKILFQKIEKGEMEAITTDLTIAEIVFVLGAPTRGKLPKKTIRHYLEPILSLPHLTTPSRKLWKAIFEIYVDKNVDFMDAYNMVLMREEGITTACSYDHDYTKVGLLKRIEP